MYAPFGNNGIKSSGLASFFSNEGRATRDFRAAEAVTAAEDAMLMLFSCRYIIAAQMRQRMRRRASRKNEFTSYDAG
jgi:hypothetical protein